MTEHQVDRHGDADHPPHWESGSDSGGRNQPQAYLGPFTLRDVVVFASVAVMFIGSLIPVTAGPGFYSNLWNSSSLFFVGLGILLPLVVAGLFVAQRVMPSSRIRIGSLSVDQFGSVIALFAAAYFFIVTVYAFAIAPLLALIGALGLVAATTLAPHLPFFASDFAGRSEVTAHVMARQTQQPAPKPAKPAKPVAAAGQDGARQGAFGMASAGNREPGQYGAAYGSDDINDYGSERDANDAAGEMRGGYGNEHAAYDDDSQAQDTYGPEQQPPGEEEGYDYSGGGEWASTGTAAFPSVGNGEQPRGDDSFGATRDSHPGTDDEDYAEEETYDAFWFAVGQTRDIIDEQTGAPVFTIEPGAWVLALQDRGDEFLVQNTDGRVGVLRDLSNIERA